MPYISDLDETYPDGQVDAGSVIDDELRGIKEVILDSYPNVTDVVIASHVNLSQLSGVNTVVQDQLNNEDTGLVELSDEPYLISGYCSGTAIEGPYGYPAMEGTWAVFEQQLGSMQVSHNMDFMLGITASDYILTVTPTHRGSDTRYPLVGIEQANNAFTVHQYNNIEKVWVSSPFYFQILLIP